MTTEIPVRPPRQAAGRATDAILATLAERIGGCFTASTVFGSPVERDGVTVIPATAVYLGLGAGSGTVPTAEKSGDGRMAVAALDPPATSRSRPDGRVSCR